MVAKIGWVEDNHQLNRREQQLMFTLLLSFHVEDHNHLIINVLRTEHISIFKTRIE